MRGSFCFGRLKQVRTTIVVAIVCLLTGIKIENATSIWQQFEEFVSEQSITAAQPFEQNNWMLSAPDSSTEYTVGFNKTESSSHGIFCQAKVEICALETLKGKIEIQQRNKDHAVLGSMIPVQDEYHVIMLMRHLYSHTFEHDKCKTIIPDWTELTTDWFCDEEPARTPDVVQVGGTMLFFCPLGVKTITGRRRDVDLSVSYDASLWKQCDDEITSTNYGIPQGTNLLGCTMVNKNSFDLFQWVEYHRVIGYDHFLVYLFEDFNATDLPDRRYITYVPWGYQPLRNDTSRAKHRAYQHGSVMDCLERARARNITWVALHDIDEYYQVMDESKSLKEILSEYPLDKNMSGLQFQTWFWGDYNATTQPHSKYVIDSVWRARFSFNDDRNKTSSREKVIARPQNFVYFSSVHTVCHRGAGPLLTDPRIRLNHYKTRAGGVYRADKGIVEDRGFRNKFLHRLKNRLKRSGKEDC